MEDKVLGAEGIVIHEGNIVLGMQKVKRWYNLEDGNKAAIVKTLGGEVEEIDGGSTENALIREIMEEVKGIKVKDIKINNNPIFTKEIKMGNLNPYQKNSTLKMKADFYFIKILKSGYLEPNDLPVLFEIPLNEFLKINLSENMPIDKLLPYISSGSNNINIELPNNFALMIPNEVKEFLIREIGDETNSNY